MRGKANAPVLGLFAAGTHDVLPIPRCVAHHPSINLAAAALQAAAAEARTPPYDDASGAGFLRYVQLTTHGVASDAPVEVTLVWASSPPAPFAPPSDELLVLVRALLDAAPANLVASVWVNYNPSRGNAIMANDSQHWAQLHGKKEYHWERFGGADCAFSPAAFLQANYGSFDALLAALADALPRGAHVADVYSGTGAIGLSLLARGVAAQLTAIELVPAAAAPFEAAVARLPEAAMRASARMHVASAGSDDALRLLAACGADVCVVDPPRKGLDAPLLRLLCDGTALPRLHTLAYVSCGFKALKRDAVALRDAGWALAAPPCAFQFFPGTNALETPVAFTRRSL